MRISPGSEMDEAYRTALGLIYASINEDPQGSSALWNETSPEIQGQVVDALTAIGVHAVESDAEQEGISVAEMIDRLRRS